MKTKLLLLGALVALQCATTQAQIPITTNTVAPVIGAYDQYYLPGPVDEATGAMTTTGNSNVSSGDNDSLTYVALDKASKGQSFTTGPNPAGYTISSVTVRHILWTNFLSNGTYMNIPSGQTFDFAFGTMSGTTLTPQLTTIATYSGTSLSMAGGGGTGIYFTFDLSGAGIGTLLPNTTYYFEIASPATAYFELHNTRTNATSYTNGTAFYGDTTANLDQSGVANLPPYGGEFAFDAALAAVGAPSVTATINPASGLAGQTFTVTATVTPGNGTVTNVSVNLSAIGGSAAASLVLSSANVYTNTFMVPSGASPGTANLAVTVKDNTPLAGTYGVLFTVLPSNCFWNGGSLVDSKWSTTNNWQGGFAPELSGNNLFFAGTARLSPDMNNSYNVTELVFSNTAGSFTIGSSTGGTLTIGSGGIVNNSASAQSLNVPITMSAAQSFNAAAGSLTLNSNLTGGAALTVPGAGTVTLAGTGASAIGNLLVTNGLLKVTAGTVTASATEGNSKIDNNGNVEVDTGATLTIADGNGDTWFPLSDTSGTTNTLTIAGGTVNVFDHWGMEAPRQGNAILNINSGSMTVSDTNQYGFNGLIMGDQGTAESGTINLNGGTLVVNKLTANNGVNTFYFNGGTLKPVYAGTFFPSSASLSAYVRNGGAIVDTAGLNVSIGQYLQHSAVAGDNATDGGLTKTGNGTLTMSGVYSFTGPIKAMGGTLSLNPALGISGTGGDLVVSNAALVLDASGGVVMPAANVTLNTGAVVTITNNASANAISGTGNLLVQTNTILNLNYGSLGGTPSAAVINVAGSMSVSGTNNVINITGSGFIVAQFSLLKYNSGSLASLSGLKLGTLPVGVNAVLVNNTANQSVDLNITLIGQNLTWYGTTALWDINTSLNWNTGAAKYLEYGTSPNLFGDLVTFDDTLNNQQFTNVNLTTALHASQITVNSSLPYSFTGAGSLAGSGSLTMSGSGSLTLGTANSYTGGTTVSAGTLIVPNDNALGASTGTLALNGGTVQFSGNTTGTRPVTLSAASTIDVSSGATAQLSGNITGGASLTKIDNGTLTLSPASTNTIGDLRLSSGQLSVTAGTVNVSDSQGSSTRIENNATLVVSGGTLNIFDGGNGWFPIGVTGGSTGTVVVAGGTINIADHWGTEVGNESGAGVLTINSGTYINHDIGGIGLLIADGGATGGTVNLNGGALIVNSLGAGAGAGGNVYLNGGSLKPIASNAGFWNNSTKIVAAVRNGGAVVDTAGFNVTIGQSLLHSTVSGDNATDGGLTKVGSGTLILSGASTYTGNTTINGGILELAQSSVTLATNSTVKIASGAQLKLDAGTVTNIVTALVLNGTTNAPGLYSSTNSSGYIIGSGYLKVLSGPTGPTGPATITNRVTGGVLSLAWPSGQGWRLQMQTNSLSQGLSTNWVYVTDGSVSSTNIAVDATKPAVFYRATYP
jgi:autotransporter-associated beta strand protein